MYAADMKIKISTGKSNNNFSYFIFTIEEFHSIKFMG